MQKTIDNVDGQHVIHTTNGVDTTTGAVYVREIKDYTPLPNGFVRELADDVLDQIRATPLLWNQDVWRTPFGLDDNYGDLPEASENKATIMFFEEVMGRKPVLADLQEQLVNVSQPNAACGTAMCFAGWVAELTAANFVFDGELLKLQQRLAKESRTGGMKWSSQRADLLHAINRVTLSDILITREEAAEVDPYHVMSLANRYPDAVLDLLKERGFTDETHRVIGTDTYARLKLGLTVDGDSAGLFWGYNTFGDIEKIVDAYTAEGPDAHRPEGCATGDEDGPDRPDEDDED